MLPTRRSTPRISAQRGVPVWQPAQDEGDDGSAEAGIVGVRRSAAPSVTSTGTGVPRAVAAARARSRDP
jgi:hypothetical protein